MKLKIARKTWFPVNQPWYDEECKVGSISRLPMLWLWLALLLWTNNFKLSVEMGNFELAVRIQINWICIRILNFGPIWIWILELSILKEISKYSSREEHFFGKKSFFNDRKCCTGKFVSQFLSLNGEFLSSKLHLLLLIYPIFTVGSRSVFAISERIQFKSGSTTLLWTLNPCCILY